MHQNESVDVAQCPDARPAPVRARTGPRSRDIAISLDHICFQPNSANSPNATALAAFVRPAISSACAYFAAPGQNASDAGSQSFNHTGYRFASLNVGGADFSQDACVAAYSTLVSECILGASPSFGGWQSLSTEVAYFLTSAVYPADPITVGNLPTSSITSSSASSSTRTAGTSTTRPPGEGTTSTKSIWTASTTTAPPIPPGTKGSDIAKQIKQDIELSLVAVLAFLAVSWMGLLAEPEAILALEAITLAGNSVTSKLGAMPEVLEATSRIQSKLEIVKYIGTVSKLFPNPVAAGILGAEIVALTTAAGELTSLPGSWKLSPPLPSIPRRGFRGSGLAMGLKRA